MRSSKVVKPADEAVTIPINSYSNRVSSLHMPSYFNRVSSFRTPSYSSFFVVTVDYIYGRAPGMHPHCPSCVRAVTCPCALTSPGAMCPHSQPRLQLTGASRPRPHSCWLCPYHLPYHCWSARSSGVSTDLARVGPSSPLFNIYLALASTTSPTVACER